MLLLLNTYVRCARKKSEDEEKANTQKHVKVSFPLSKITTRYYILPLSLSLSLFLSGARIAIARANPLRLRESIDRIFLLRFYYKCADTRADTRPLISVVHSSLVFSGLFSLTSGRSYLTLPLWVYPWVKRARHIGCHQWQ